MLEPKELLSFSDQEVPVCVCLLSCFSHVQLYATLWTATHQAPLSMGFSRQEYWSRLPCPPPEDLPNPGTEPASSALQVASLPTEPPGNPPRKYLLLSKLTSEYHFHIRYRQGTEGLLNLWRPQQTLKCRGKAFVAFNSRNSVYPHNYVGFNCIVSKNAVKS